jgi:hypothetical protein
MKSSFRVDLGRIGGRPPYATRNKKRVMLPNVMHTESCKLRRDLTESRSPASVRTKGSTSPGVILRADQQPPPSLHKFVYGGGVARAEAYDRVADGRLHVRRLC